MPFCRERTARAQRRLRATPSSHADPPSNRPHHASQSVTSVRLAGHVSCKYARATPPAQRHDRLPLRDKSLRVTRVRYVGSSGDVTLRRTRSRTRDPFARTVHVDAGQDMDVRRVTFCKTASDTSQRKCRRAKRIFREPGVVQRIPGGAKATCARVSERKGFAKPLRRSARRRRCRRRRESSRACTPPPRARPTHRSHRMRRRSRRRSDTPLPPRHMRLEGRPWARPDVPTDSPDRARKAAPGRAHAGRPPRPPLPRTRARTARANPMGKRTARAATRTAARNVKRATLRRPRPRIARARQGSRPLAAAPTRATTGTARRRRHGRSAMWQDSHARSPRTAGAARSRKTACDVGPRVALSTARVIPARASARSPYACAHFGSTSRSDTSEPSPENPG